MAILASSVLLSAMLSGGDVASILRRYSCSDNKVLSGSVVVSLGYACSGLTKYTRLWES